MESTLKNRYRIIFYRICMINPPHTKKFIPGIGSIKEEWSWCWDNLQYLKVCIMDHIEFNRAAENLIKYIKIKK